MMKLHLLLVSENPRAGRFLENIAHRTTPQVTVPLPDWTVNILPISIFYEQYCTNNLAIVLSREARAGFISLSFICLQRCLISII